MKEIAGTIEAAAGAITELASLPEETVALTLAADQARLQDGQMLL